MDFLNSIALPQPTEHFHLLLFMFNLLGLLFFPYLSLVAGNVFFAYYFDRRGRLHSHALDLRLSEDLLTCALPNKSTFVFLAIFPALALTLIYAQILQGTQTTAPGAMLFALLLLIAGGLALVTFRFASRVQLLDVSFRSGRDRDSGDQRPTRSLVRARARSGIYALVFIAVAAYLSMAAFGDALQSGAAGSPDFNIMLNPLGWLKFLHLLLLACGLTATALFFYAFSWEGGVEDPEGDYGTFVRRFGLRLAGFSLLAQPPVLVLESLMVPRQALSGELFLLVGGTIVLLFVSLHFVYATHHQFRAGYVTYAFFALLGATVLLVTKDQVALHTATKGYAAILARESEREVEMLSAAVGVGAPQMTGEDIYNGKCSACHLFDAKKVGPPYAEVVPKYAGRKAALVSFILNPSKVNPAYPPMPAQGLKPAEADSIASFLLKKTGAKGS